MSDVEFTCRLDALDTAEQRRYQALRTAMKAAVEDVTPLPDGYALRLRADAAVFRDVSEWITLERRWCPFLALGLEWTHQSFLPRGGLN